MGRDLRALCTAVKIQNIQWHISLHKHHGYRHQHMPICHAQARVFLICDLSHCRGSNTFRDTLWGENSSSPVGYCSRESMKIKSNCEKAGSHQNPVLLQHSRSQHPRSGVCVHGHVTDSPEHNTKHRPGALWFAASHSCQNSPTV